MPDATIAGKRTKPIPADTRAAIKRGVPERKAVSMTTKPKSMVKVG